MSSKVTAAEHTAIGAFGGIAEVCFMQPMVGIKNALQEGRPIPTNPLHLYRGLLMNCVSIAPITATQFGTNSVLRKYMSPNGEPMSQAATFGCAALSGSLSSGFATPTELIIIQQQKSGRSLIAEASNFYRTYGLGPLMRGLFPCAGRETIYAGGYLGLAPIMKDIMDGSDTFKSYPAAVSVILSGIVGGVFAAGVSHPFDTIKTRMQAFMYSKPDYATFWSTAKTVYGEGGLPKFWSGCIPRMTRIIFATMLLNTLRTKSVAYLEEVRS